MSKRTKLTSRERIKFRIRKKIIGTSNLPRLVVYRSLNNIYAQMVDDINSKTLLTVSSLSKDVENELKAKQPKTNKSKVVGQLLAKKAKEINIKKVVFDRNGYLYHGRIKSLADGAREGGLEF